jgi:hypothetical protein
MAAARKFLSRLPDLRPVRADNMMRQGGPIRTPRLVWA